MLDIRNDAILLHGMSSNPGEMAHLGRALEKRGHYRKVWPLDLGWKQKVIPQARTRDTAESVLEKEIEPRIRRGQMADRIDIIGHSNGGYVALHLADLVRAERIGSIFTLGTPHGMETDYPMPQRVRARTYHLVGALDAVTGLAGSHPDAARTVIEFPLEAHSSLHVSAEDNGVANVMCKLAGGNPGHMFVDSGGVIHPWEFCRDEARSVPWSHVQRRPFLTVCDGLHDGELEAWERLRVGVGLGQGKPLTHPLRFAVYLAYRSRLESKIRGLKREALRLRGMGDEAERELQALKAETAKMRRMLVQFDAKLSKHVRRVKSALNLKLRDFKNALISAERVATGKRFDNRSLLETMGLLEVALEHHSALRAEVREATAIRSPANELPRVAP